MGKILVLVGLLLVAVGLVLQYANKIPFLGKMPGDFVYERGNVKIYFPLMTSIVISIILSLIVFLISRFRN